MARQGISTRYLQGFGPIAGTVLTVSAQRAGSAVEASRRSIHPNIPGLPWWAALLIATTATAIGYAIDAGSGHKDLTDVFAVLYIAGCVVAVLVVRQSGVFTAVIQPPLILFCAVPGAYWLFHGGKVGNLKDLLINCGYPLIERFPLMLGTAGGVLLIGLIRWYFGLTHRTTNGTDDVADAPSATETPEAKSVISGIAAKLASVLGRDADDEDDEVRPPTPSGSRRSTGAAGRPAELGPPNDPPEAAPAILEPRWSRTTKRRPSGGGTEAAVARRPPAISNPTSRPVGRAAARGRRTMTRTPSRRGKCVGIRMVDAMATSGRRSRLRSLRRLQPVRVLRAVRAAAPSCPERCRPDTPPDLAGPLPRVSIARRTSRTVRRRAPSRAPESIAHTGSVPGPAPC